MHNYRVRETSFKFALFRLEFHDFRYPLKEMIVLFELHVYPLPSASHSWSRLFFTFRFYVNNCLTLITNKGAENETLMFC